MPIFVWTRSEATTALTVFHIWYCGGDLCLCTHAESSALVEFFCILHGWGRVFAEPDLFPYMNHSIDEREGGHFCHFLSKFQVLSEEKRRKS
jgi:hypothetical protein